MSTEYCISIVGKICDITDARPPRIEVINLDRWVSQFLKRKDFAREVAFFGEARERLDQIWREVFDDHELLEGLSEPFVKAEWSQIVQAKGPTDKRGYLKTSRTGRGTPLDRRKRATLWDMFDDYRARIISEGLAEPDDAYREAKEILASEAPNLPYTAVIVDEAQDMGEQAFRLIRAIVPESPAGDQNHLHRWRGTSAHLRTSSEHVIMRDRGAWALKTSAPELPNHSRNQGMGRIHS